MTYTEYHPRWYRPRVSVFWWARRRSYLAFVLRELSSIFVVWFVVFLLLLVRAVGDGRDSYERFLDWSASPWVVGLNVVALAFVLLHAITWLFTLSPHAIVVRRRGRRLPPAAIGAANLVALALVSGLVVLIVLE